MKTIVNLIVVASMFVSQFSLPYASQALEPKSPPSTTDISTGITLGTSRFVSADENVPILSEEIAKQAQAQPPQEKPLQIKLSAEPSIYIPGKPIVITWKVTGGFASKEGDFSIIVRSPDGVIPANNNVEPLTDGSVVISPKTDTGMIAWKVLDYAKLPFTFTFDLIVKGEVINNNSVVIDQPLGLISTAQSSKIQSNDNQVQVTVPASAARGNMVMDVRYPSPNSLGSSPLTWNPVEIIAVDQGTGKNITHFANPITIQISYDEKKIFDWSEQDLSIYYYNPDLLEWFPMQTVVDTVNNTLTVQSDHLTVFDYKANNWQSQMLPTVDSFKVSDFTGAGTYQINMWTPPAPGGLQPSVTLSYNSQIVDEASTYQQASWVGMGWDLDTGLVTRNMHGTDNILSDDTFSISAGGVSGQLIPISSSGGITQYNTANQSFMKVESNENTYSWTAWTKDGTKYVFTDTTDTNNNNGCATSNNITWRWGLTSITDSHGNTLIYKYQSEKKNCIVTGTPTTPGANEIAVYPTTINYGNGKYRISFVTDGRTDYQTSWEASDSRTLYGTKMLKQVIVEHCPSGNSTSASAGDCPGATTIRRYELSYAPNNTTNIFPNFSYTAGGKTLTLAGVQEFGADGSALPPVTFVYGNSMHLTTVNNGQGGSVVIDYTAWSYTDDINVVDVRSLTTTFDTTFPPDGCKDISGILPSAWSKAGGEAQCNGGNAHYLQLGLATKTEEGQVARGMPEGLIKPSSKYRFAVWARKIDNNSGTTTSITWGFEDNGVLETKTASSINVNSGNTVQISYPVLPANFTASTKIRLHAAKCFVVKFELTLIPTYYRVTTRTVTVQPTGLISTYTYDYDNASPATVDNSAAVARGGTLYTKKLREFRGNAMSQVTFHPDGISTNPGLATVNWFSQADETKGRAYDTLTLYRKAFDALDNANLGTSWTATGTYNATMVSQKDFDNSIQTSGGSLTRTTSLNNGDVAIAHIRLSGSAAQGQVGLQGSTIISLSNGSAFINGTPLLNNGNFKIDEWYAVMIFADSAHGNRVRIWQLDNPNNSAEVVTGGGTGRFFTSITGNGASIYTDSYFEGTPYSETITRYNSIVQYDTTANNAIPDVANTGLMTFEDLGVTWVYPSSVESRNYNGDAAFVGTKQDYTYNTTPPLYGYGNMVSQAESGNNGSGWLAYRTTNYEYYPVVSPAITPTKYLINFPARQTVTDPANNNNLLAETLYFYDGQTAYTSSPIKGDLTTQRVWAGGTNYAQTSMTYYPNGNLWTQSAYTEYGTAIASPPTSSVQTTTTEYDTVGYNTYPAKVKNQLLQEVNTTYNYALGLPDSVTDANGATTSATYDGFGRMKTITAPGDASATLQVNYFDTSIPVKVDLIQTVSATSTIRLSRFYDGAGRQIQTQTASAVVNGALSNVVVDYKYDAVGRLVAQTVPYTIANTALPATPVFNAQTFTSTNSTNTSYDVIGRSKTITAPNQTQVNYSYGDLTTTVTDSYNNPTTTTTDVWGRTTLVDSPSGPDVSYGYDVLNRLTNTWRNNANTHINYDILGRKLNMTDPDMGYWQYQYDALGNLKSQTDAKNQLTCLYYDALNRLDGKVYSTNGECSTTTPAALDLDVNYNYDENPNGIGHRTSMYDASGSAVWSYDFRGRLVSESKTVLGTPLPFVTSWTYNSGDLPDTMTYPVDNEKLTYGYNSDGTLKSVASSTGGTYMNDMKYDEAGRLKLLQYGNNVINKTFNYFPWNTANMGGLLSNVTTNSSSSLQNLSYKYDKNGNVQTITDALSGPQTQTFTYDALNRIKTASATGGTNGLYSESYDYDSASGNLSLKSGLAYTYGDTSHVHAATSLSNGNWYEYDLNGNMISRNISTNPSAGLGQAYTLGYDEESRLTSVDVQTIEMLVPIFADVPNGYLHKSEIEAIYTAGITGGCASNPLRYCPTTDVTRAQMAVFLVRAKHGAAFVPPTATGIFADVPVGSFAANYIEQLAADGITSGCGGGNYCPNSVVTRSQMAIFIVRVMHGVAYVPPTATGIFADVSVGSFGANYIEQLVADGIISAIGCGGGNYCPNSNMTREQMAYFLAHALNLPLAAVSAFAPLFGGLDITETPTSTDLPAATEETVSDTPSPTVTTTADTIEPAVTETETLLPADTSTPVATELPVSTPTPLSILTEEPTQTIAPALPFESMPLPLAVFTNSGFTYNGDGQRVKSVITTEVDTTTTYFVGNHYEVSDGVVTKYYYAGSQRIAMRKNGTLNYLLSDHLGSTSLVINDAGGIVSEMKYKAWGEVRYSSGNEVTKYQYTGQYSYASDFGLLFYNARMYDPQLGRFTSADTVVPGGVQGLDRYAYVNNSPLRYTDPSGHESVCGTVYSDPECNSYDPFFVSKNDIKKVEQAQKGYGYWLNLGIHSVNNLRNNNGWWTPYLYSSKGMDAWKFLLRLAYTMEAYSIPGDYSSSFKQYMTDSFINKAGDFYAQYGVAGLYLFLGTREAFTDRTILDSQSLNWIVGKVEYRNTWEFGPGAVSVKQSGRDLYLPVADKMYPVAGQEMNSAWNSILNYQGVDMYGTGAIDVGVDPPLSMDGKNVIWQLTITGINPWDNSSSYTIYAIGK